MKCEPVKYNLLRGPVPPGFIYLLDIIQLRTRILRPLDKVMVCSITHAIKTKWSKHQMNINFKKDHYDNDLRIRADKSAPLIVYLKKHGFLYNSTINWKSWSECADVLSDLGLFCLHKTQRPFFIIWYNCPGLIQQTINWWYLSYFNQKRYYTLCMKCQTLSCVCVCGGGWGEDRNIWSLNLR